MTYISGLNCCLRVVNRRLWVGSAETIPKAVANFSPVAYIQISHLMVREPESIVGQNGQIFEIVRSRLAFSNDGLDDNGAEVVRALTKWHQADRDPDELTAILSSRLNYSKGVRDGDRSPIGKADRELDWVNVTVNRALDEGLD